MSKSKEITATFHMVGDKVMWKGIKLVVCVLHEDGSLEASSPTMRVKVETPQQFEKYRGE